MPFIPHTSGDVRRMLDTLNDGAGADDLDTLFDEIPRALRCKPLAGVPEGLSEMEVTRLMNERSAQDAGALCFIGAGAYEHHI
ncbi:MAG: hypothetical protein VW625_03515, partial [Perlucidibaca sp.]